MVIAGNTAIGGYREEIVRCDEEWEWKVLRRGEIWKWCVSICCCESTSMGDVGVSTSIGDGNGICGGE